jgi:NADPH-dependent glutamate synthase beta subunit-like oxidoreductase
MFKEALAIIRETNPFPSICGRVCHHPCEAECNRALVDEPVAIQWLKRFAADYGLKNSKKPAPIKKTKKERVAVIGSGPAGLTAAYDLVRQGYGITVYEALPAVGGMLIAGIPEFVLPRSIVEAEIEYIRALGVNIRTGTCIGDVLSLEDLSNLGFDAFLLATGAQSSNKLKISGTELTNIHHALPLLQRVKSGEKIPFRGRVVIIGGGNVAIDTARTVRRLGSSDVHIACLESRRDMPAFPWETEAAEREGIKIHMSLAPQRFIPRHGGNGRKGIIIDFQRVASTQFDTEGLISWTLLEGAGCEYSMEADSVVVAIGQSNDPSYAYSTGLAITQRGNFIADPDTLATNIPGIFAAGDAVSTRGTVTEAIAMGHKAAISIHRYLRGQDLRGNRTAAAKEVLRIDPKLTSPWLTSKSRWTTPMLPPGDAVRTFEEPNLGYTEAEAMEEAKRCLNCRMCANCIYGRSQICFETGSRLLK